MIGVVVSAIAKRPATARYFSSLRPPLEGIKVVDISRVLAGPFCAMLLGDLGADVIKIERPGLGDELRTWGPPFKEPLNGGTKESTYFLAVNRNKRSMTVNLKHDLGKQIIYDLVKDADVFLENYIPGAMNKLGLGYDKLSSINPGLIYCSFSGFGPRGPYANRAGYDAIIQGIGGMIYTTGETDLSRPGVKAGVPIADLSTGLYAHGAIMAALLARARDGVGQKIDTNLMSSQVSLFVHVGSAYLNNGIEADRLGTLHPTVCPYQGFPTADGDLIVAAANNPQFQKLCVLLEVPYLLDEDRFATNADRVHHRQELSDLLDAKFRTKTTSEWEKILDGSGLPFGPINGMHETLNHPQIVATELVKEMDHPSVGNIRVIGPPVDYSHTKSIDHTPPPTLGQHTHEILQNVLGYDKSKIQNIVNENVV